MIDEILEFIVSILADLIPNTVWKIIFFLAGIVTTAIGAAMINESTRVGSALILVGTLLMVISLVLFYR